MNEQANAEEHGSTPEKFRIKDCALIAIASGARASTLRELRDNLASTSEASIYYHFWGSLLHPRFAEREYNNDFASWAARSLHDNVLAERLAVVDPTEFENLEAMRGELIEIVDDRLDESENAPWFVAQDAFEFLRSQIVVFDTGKHAATPEELARFLPEISTSSVFYHFIDARRRLQGRHTDDFSAWLGCFPDAHESLCSRLGAIDANFSSLSELKSTIEKFFREEFAWEEAL